MQDKTIKLYAHPACSMVPVVTTVLKGAKVDYVYINIYEDNIAREFVREVNNGYESVPTLLFPDGSTLTEPSTGALKNKLNKFGYDVPLKSLIIANLPKFILWAIIGYSVLRFLGVI
jgi:mycoredoxin